MSGSESDLVLQANHLEIDMRTEAGDLPIIRDVSISVAAGQTLGIVGESGSGKTVTCLGLTRLLQSPPAVYSSGEVFFEGRDIWQLPEEQLQKVRGRKISVIFQEAMSALNPVISVGKQVAEMLTYHLDLSSGEADTRVVSLFEKVGIPDPERRLSQFPHQLSGGLQQRVMIAMALACNPTLLIADEPTTALDVTIQVQILRLLKSLQDEYGMSMIFVSHDLGVIAEICQNVAVMYAGQVVESGSVAQIFSRPRHPYTQMLLKTIPRLDRPRGQLSPIPGQIPSPSDLPPGCKFHPRCPHVMPVCRQSAPEIRTTEANSTVRCFLENQPASD